MLSEQLSQSEQELVAAISADLDGLPYPEKAPVIAASLEAMRKRNRVDAGASRFSPPRAQAAGHAALRVA